MRRLSYGTSVLVATAAVFALALATAATASTSRTNISGKISADGSATVGPYVQAAAERFERRNPGAKVTVGISGTGGGFERFCRGETDLSNASRPIKQSESAKCRRTASAMSRSSSRTTASPSSSTKPVTWINCITPIDSRKIWDKGSTVNNWADVRQGFPNVPLKLFRPNWTRHVRLLHREDQRQGEAEPLGLHGERGRQRARTRRRGRARSDGLLRLLLLRGEQEPAQAAEGQQRLVSARRASPACRQSVQATLAATLRLREADFLRVGRSSVHQVHHRERASHRTGFPVTSR